VKRLIANLTVTFLVVTACWNIWRYFQNVADLLPRSSEGIVVQEDRYRSVRDLLKVMGYPKGPIGFITNRDLKAEPYSAEETAQWGRAQYVMVPWIMIRNGRGLDGPPVSGDAPFVIGDFWDGVPAKVPSNLVKVLDTGQGVILFRRTSQ
jgi:hypothetical protein